MKLLYNMSCILNVEKMKYVIWIHILKVSEKFVWYTDRKKIYYKITYMNT